MAPKAKPKPEKRSVLLWDRTYTILRYDAPPDEYAGPLEPRCLGMLDEDARIIHIRKCVSSREETRTILHELIHHSLGANFSRISEKKMAVLDEHLLDNLEALGVDLSPLLGGYR